MGSPSRGGAAVPTGDGRTIQVNVGSTKAPVKDNGLWLPLHQRCAVVQHHLLHAVQAGGSCPGARWPARPLQWTILAVHLAASLGPKARAGGWEYCVARGQRKCASDEGGTSVDVSGPGCLHLQARHQR